MQSSVEEDNGEAPSGARDVKELVKKAGLFSWANEGSWGTLSTLTYKNAQQDEVKRLLIGFAPLFIDYTQSGSFFAVISLAAVGRL